MTNNSIFFKVLWLVKIVVIFALGLCGLMIAVVVSQNVLKGNKAARYAAHIPTVEELRAKEEILELGSISDIYDTSYYSMVLRSNLRHEQSHYGKGSGYRSARNYLFINAKTNEKSWLYSHNNFLILRTDILVFEKENQKTRTPVGYIFQLVKSDSNSDRVINNQDKKTVAISNFMGKKYLEIATEIDQFLGHQINAAGILSFVYKSEGNAHLKRVNLNNFSIMDNEKIEIPKASE